MIRTAIISLLFASQLGCGSFLREANIEAVEKLRVRLTHDAYHEVYKDSSNILQAQLTQSEFAARLATAVAELKTIDPNLNWKRINESPEPAVYNDETWSALSLEKDGRKVSIQLDWDPGFKLCGILINGDIPDQAKRVFRNCD